MIICVDDDANGFLAKGALKWAKEMGVNALAVSPDKKECGYHSYPLEQIENAGMMCCGIPVNISGE